MLLDTISMGVFCRKSKLAQHAYEEGNRESWYEARILGTQSNGRYRKRPIWHA
jgi:hypothetical protein